MIKAGEVGGMLEGILKRLSAASLFFAAFSARLLMALFTLSLISLKLIIRLMNIPLKLKA